MTNHQKIRKLYTNFRLLESTFGQNKKIDYFSLFEIVFFFFISGCTFYSFIKLHYLRYGFSPQLFYFLQLLCIEVTITLYFVISNQIIRVIHILSSFSKYLTSKISLAEEELKEIIKSYDKMHLTVDLINEIFKKSTKLIKIKLISNILLAISLLYLQKSRSSYNFAEAQMTELAIGIVSVGNILNF